MKIFFNSKSENIRAYSAHPAKQMSLRTLFCHCFESLSLTLSLSLFFLTEHAVAVFSQRKKSASAYLPPKRSHPITSHQFISFQVRPKLVAEKPSAAHHQHHSSECCCHSAATTADTTHQTPNNRKIEIEPKEKPKNKRLCPSRRRNS